MDLTQIQKNTVNKILETIVDKENVTKNVSKIWEAGKCDKCNNTGYKGRIGIFEAIVMNDEVEVLIKKSASEREIANAAIKQGILTLPQDGILKILRGDTSFAELERVLDLEEVL